MITRFLYNHDTIYFIQHITSKIITLIIVKYDIHYDNQAHQ